MTTRSPEVDPTPHRKGPASVLHVIGSLDPGGVERWLLSLFAETRERVQHTVLALGAAPGSLEDLATGLGVGVLRCPLGPSASFPRRFSRTLRAAEPGVVHSHVHHATGALLWLARRCGVRVRIAHSHTTEDVVPSTFARRVYRELSERLIRQHATAGVAVATEAAEALFGRAWARDPRFRVLPYGIDLTPFAEDVSREEVRRQLGLPEDTVLVGQLARFHPVKNHVFSLRVAAALAQGDPRLRFVFIGDGPSRPGSERAAEEYGIRSRCTFVGGAFASVPRLLAGLDLLLHPSLFEGLPVALLEAQAAGVRVLASASITREIEAVPGLVRFADLGAGPERWAAVAREALALPRPSREDARARLGQSDFDIRRNARRFLELYEAA